MKLEEAIEKLEVYYNDLMEDLAEELYLSETLDDAHFAYEKRNNVKEELLTLKHCLKNNTLPMYTKYVTVDNVPSYWQYKASLLEQYEERRN